MDRPDLERRLDALASLAAPVRLALYGASPAASRAWGVTRRPPPSASPGSWPLTTSTGSPRSGCSSPLRAPQRPEWARCRPVGKDLPALRQPARGRPAIPKLPAHRRAARRRGAGGPLGRRGRRARAGSPRRRRRERHPRRRGPQPAARRRRRARGAGPPRLRAVRRRGRDPAAQLPIPAAGADPPGAGLPGQPRLRRRALIQGLTARSLRAVLDPRPGRCCVALS
jgi:hypothetical protein